MVNEELKKWYNERRKGYERLNLKINDLEYNNRCVYKIENLNNGRVYIGECINYHARVVMHISGITTGNHHCKELLDDYNKGDKFEISIIRKFMNSKTAPRRKCEAYHIKKAQNPYNKRTYSK